MVSRSRAHRTRVYLWAVRRCMGAYLLLILGPNPSLWRQVPGHIHHAAPLAGVWPPETVAHHGDHAGDQPSNGIRIKTDRGDSSNVLKTQAGCRFSKRGICCNLTLACPVSFHPACTRPEVDTQRALVSARMLMHRTAINSPLPSSRHTARLKAPNHHPQIIPLVVGSDLNLQRPSRGPHK